MRFCLPGVDMNGGGVFEGAKDTWMVTRLRESSPGNTALAVFKPDVYTAHAVVAGMLS